MVFKAVMNDCLISASASPWFSPQFMAIKTTIIISTVKAKSNGALENTYVFVSLSFKYF
jgi:hypothetical protein